MDSKPEKEYTVQLFDIRLKCGARVEFNIREDLGHSVVRDLDGWMMFNFPKERRTEQILVSEIAALGTQEITQREVPLYKPRHAEKEVPISNLDA